MVEQFALNTKDTLEFVNQHDIVTLRAEWTDESPEIDRQLEKHGSISIPLTVIYPAQQPDKPIVLRDLYTKSTLLRSLQQAVTTPKKSDVQASRSETVLK